MTRLLVVEAVILILFGLGALLQYRVTSQEVPWSFLAYSGAAYMVAVGALNLAVWQILHDVKDKLRYLAGIIHTGIDRANSEGDEPWSGDFDELDELISSLTILLSQSNLALLTVQKRADELATLNLVAEIINRTLDLQVVLDTSLREALKVVGWELGAIYMWDERADALDMVTFLGLNEATLRQIFSFRLGESEVGEAARMKRTILITPENPNSLPSSMASNGISICIPLLTASDELMGVFCIGTETKKTFSPDELKLISTLAHQTTTAIENAKLYAEISNHATRLEALVRERTFQLNQAIEDLSIALQKAQEAEKVKTQLLSTVSHELRTPLATIKGNTSLLTHHFRQLSPEIVDEHLQDIEEETDKLTDLITDLLEMSRIDAGMLYIHVEPFDVAKTLQDSVGSARTRLHDHEFLLEVQEPLPLGLGDIRRFDQIVANLLNNAAKYSPPDTPIRVRSWQDTNRLVVSVSDKGKGISQDKLDRIFDRFYQIDTVRDSYRKGIGLGLAICRGLVEAQSGQIWVDSEPNQGSTFYFSLPIAAVTVQSETQGELA